MKNYIKNLHKIAKVARKRVIAFTLLLLILEIMLHPIFLSYFIVNLFFFSIVFVLRGFDRKIFTESYVLPELLMCLDMRIIYDILFNHYYLRYTCKECKEKICYSVNIKSNEIERTNIWDFYNPKEKICYTCLRDRER